MYKVARIASIALIAFFILSIQQEVSALETDRERNVEPTKTFTISLNTEVQSSALEDGFVVKNANGEVVNTDVSFGETQKKVKVAAPEGGYKDGKTYTLHILKDQVCATQQSCMNNNIELSFTIDGDFNPEKVLQKIIDEENDVQTMIQNNLQQWEEVQKPISDIPEEEFRQSLEGGYTKEYIESHWMEDIYQTASRTDFYEPHRFFPLASHKLSELIEHEVVKVDENTRELYVSEFYLHVPKMWKYTMKKVDDEWLIDDMQSIFHPIDHQSMITNTLYNNGTYEFGAFSGENSHTIESDLPRAYKVMYKEKSKDDEEYERVEPVKSYSLNDIIAKEHYYFTTKNPDGEKTGEYRVGVEDHMLYDVTNEQELDSEFYSE
ncbi:hypothetical protein [Pontibacillus yanchengensis]|uniref:SbsA Ig-like domain-containing protein n=1 Tax=Pontibacillus yanchengensis Y32 TaxID=1385514 RepID=A0A0A2TFS4_9BACI|nr:hypothetical protein [Pontibacillus yanchengensis]KGP74707.1 hypothetical protein N782_00735 [Pontibacillus yanchengensis Y32]